MASTKKIPWVNIKFSPFLFFQEKLDIVYVHDQNGYEIGISWLGLER